jgi:hypothetical protein
MKRRNFIKSIALLPVGLISASGQKSEKEIFLFDFYLAGYPYYKAHALLYKLKPGDEIILKPEPDNKYDEQAIEVYTIDKQKLGYVPAVSNTVPYNLFSNNIKMKARIKEVKPESDHWERILISIYQVVDA